MAYAALETLRETLDQILKHDYDDLITRSVKQEIISIRLQAVGLQLNVKHYPNKERIIEAASSTLEIIEFLFCDGGSTVRLADRLRELAERLESTAGDVVDFIKGKGSGSFCHVGQSSYSGDVGSSSSLSSSKDVVVGLEQDLELIKDRLITGPSRLRVLPIVGTGGIGKTTLAKLVYNDALIVKTFTTCAWVTISQDHSVERVILNLLASIKGISAVRDAESNIPMESLICEYLKRRRYLIVIDDMWSNKAWDDVKMLFPRNNNGSRIILTTRLQDVAAYVDASSSIHTMSVLDAHHSWNLLKQKVFGDKDVPIELEDIGKKIVKNCGGLPLSIVVVAGLLSNFDTRYSWKQIAENEVQLETIICSSYTHLPSHSKSCLLYMAGFPEDHEIHVSELTKIWIAEGFVTRSNESKSLEEEAEDCLEDLAKRSLVLVTSRNFDGKVKSCSLHDIVRDFCVRQAGKEKLILPVMDYLPTPILRRHFLPRLVKDHHIISATSYDLLHLKDSVHSSQIRTIICTPKKGYRCVGSVEKFSSLKVLHVLCRSDHWDWEPGQVFDLIHLTYLASNIPSSNVPSAISKLQNLQTLKIYRSEVRLPVEIWRLRQLRHLIAFSFQPLPHPEEKQIPLENLHTLSLARDFVCSARMVRMIPNIKKLGICYSKDADADAGHSLDNLKHLSQLEKLKLEMHGRECDELKLELDEWEQNELNLHLDKWFCSKLELEELELKIRAGFSLRRGTKIYLKGKIVDKILGWISFRRSLNPLFPLLLKSLTLSGWRLPWSVMTIIGSLPNLQVLKLRNYACIGEYWETNEGEFRELRLLLIDRSDLEYWTTHDSHFPRLECLVLRQCHSLCYVPSNIGDIPTLKLIEIDDDNSWRRSSLLVSANEIQRKQRDSGNDSFQVRVKRS